jgi:hypothetical protein
LELIKIGNAAAAPDPNNPPQTLEQNLQTLLAEYREVSARKRALKKRIVAITRLLHGKR